MQLFTFALLGLVVLAAVLIAWSVVSRTRVRIPSVPPAILALAAHLEDQWDDIRANSELVRPGTLVCEVVSASRASVNSQLKNQLKAVNEEIGESRDNLASAQSELDQAKAEMSKVDGTPSQDSPEFKALQEAARKVGSIKDDIAEKQGVQVGLLEALGESDPDVDRAKRENSDRRNEAPAGAWNSNGLFTQDMRSELARVAHSKGRIGGIELGEVADRDSFAADITGTTNMRRGQFYGVLPQLFRPLRVLDLLPTGTMDANTLPYTQESGTFLAAETAEGIAKPEDGVTYTDAEASAQTIAAWQKIRKQALADVPALQSVIDARLRYSVLRRLEAEVLNGNGSGSNLTGILQTSGTGSVAFDGSRLPADQVLKGITTVLLADAYADGIVMNPLDWESALEQKATGGDEQYYSGGPFRATPQVMWGVPLIPSPAIPQGKALVGDFAIGAMLFIREGVNVLLSDSDQDDFIKNRVTLLGEMRAALPVWRPSAFTVVNLA